MRELPPLSTFLAIVAERKRALGISGEAYLRVQNRGRRRTPEKRELCAASTAVAARTFWPFFAC